MLSKNKTKKLAQKTDKNKETQRDDGPSSPTASQDGDTEEETVNLNLILREIREFRQDNNKQLEDIKGEIVKTNLRLDEAEARIVGAEERLQNVEEMIEEMLKLQEHLQRKLIDQEGRSRRANVRIYGVPEGAEGKPGLMIPFVEKLIRENLDISDAKDLQIERAHRALAPQPPAGAHPRSIVIRFLSYRMKEEVLKRAWQNKGFMWNNCKISLDHDYAPEILAKRKEFAETRRVLKENNIRFQTPYPARLRVFFDEGIKTYATVEEATSDLAERGLPIKVITQPETILERIRQKTWQPVRGSRSTRTKGSNYKERLQIFRRERTESKD